jgi:hypothetical protein
MLEMEGTILRLIVPFLTDKTLLLLLMPYQEFD